MKARHFLFLLPLTVLIFGGGCSHTLTISTGSIKRTIAGSVRDGIVVYNNSSVPCQIVSYELNLVITALDDPAKVLTDTIPANYVVRVGVRDWWFFENNGSNHREIIVIPLVKRADGLKMETKKIRWDTGGGHYGRQDGNHRAYAIEDDRSRSGALIGIKIK